MTKFHFMDLFFRESDWSTGSLPYEVISEDINKGLTINIAVAGFPVENLEVSHSDDGIITIVGTPVALEKTIYVYHAGLARRAFTFKFPVSKSYSIKDITHKNGILSLNLVKNTSKSNTYEIKQL
jgi:HSP20 family molecular chaperone IbpA